MVAGLSRRGRPPKAKAAEEPTQDASAHDVDEDAIREMHPISRWRLIHGISQIALSHMCSEHTGTIINQSQISLWEGKRRLSLESMRMISTVTLGGVTVRELMRWQQKHNGPSELRRGPKRTKTGTRSTLRAGKITDIDVKTAMGLDKPRRGAA